MMTSLLMNQKKWEQHFKRLSACAPREGYLMSRLLVANSKALRHFDYDYSDCIASKEMGSEVAEKLVSYHFIHDPKGRNKHDINHREHVLSLHVIFDNGESLSQSEAIGGLGDCAPHLLRKRIKEVHNARLRDDRVYKGSASYSPHSQRDVQRAR